MGLEQAQDHIGFLFRIYFHARVSRASILAQTGTDGPPD